MNRRQRKKKFKKELRRNLLSLMNMILRDVDESIKDESHSFHTIKSNELRCIECGSLVDDLVFMKTRQKEDFNLCTNCKNKKQ